MTASVEKQRCDECESNVPIYDAILLCSESEGSSRHLCTRCFNMVVTKNDGSFEHPDFQPIQLSDVDGHAHEFHFQTRHGGNHIAIEAFEIGKDGMRGGF